MLIVAIGLLIVLIIYKCGIIYSADSSVDRNIAIVEMLILFVAATCIAMRFA